jgi:isopentenyl diphosphate isomerase/L-lactate dehydrogenase-like FMN-dependent dehydrogenase
MVELITITDYENSAAVKLPRGIYDFFAGGANDVVTLRENKEAFNRLKLMPRIWGRSVSSTGNLILGHTMQVITNR